MKPAELNHQSETSSKQTGIDHLDRPFQSLFFSVTLSLFPFLYFFLPRFILSLPRVEKCFPPPSPSIFHSSPPSWAGCFSAGFAGGKFETILPDATSRRLRDYSARLRTVMLGFYLRNFCYRRSFWGSILHGNTELNPGLYVLIKKREEGKLQLLK